MTNTAAEAIAWMRNQQQHGPAIWGGLCLKDVRTSLGIPSRDYSAAQAWDRAQYKHRTSHGRDVPRGVAYFWTGGSSGYGHIVLSVGGGMCYSNDVRRHGHIDLVSIDSITANWGQHPQGWTEDLNGVHYYQSAAQWAGGDVYLDKLRHGTHDSDSVKRLQYRLLNHSHVPAKGVRITGNYGDGTASAVEYWQKKVSRIHTGPSDGRSLTLEQARKLFGDRVQLHR